MSRPGFNVWNMAGSGSGLMEATVQVTNRVVGELQPP